MSYVPTPRICLGCLSELQVRPNRTLPITLCDPCALLPQRALAMQVYHNAYQRKSEARVGGQHRVRLSRVQQRAALLESYQVAGKMCSECLTAKPVSAFSVSEGRLDGLAIECRECIKIRSAVLAFKGAENNGMGSAKANKARWLALRDTFRDGRVPARATRANGRVVLSPERQAALDKVLRDAAAGVPFIRPATDTTPGFPYGRSGHPVTPAALPDSLPAHLAQEKT